MDNELLGSSHRVLAEEMVLRATRQCIDWEKWQLPSGKQR
jgi:hypothetical protein